MDMRKQKIFLYIVAVVLVGLIAVTYFSKETTTLYGNDELSIIKLINSFKDYKNSEINILDIKDINDQRIVSFLSDSNPAYMELIKNRNGNYQWRYFEKQTNASFAPFIVNLSLNNSFEHILLVITNKENTISKMEFTVNNQTIVKNFNIKQNTVTWIDLPKENSLELKYNFYDEHGDILN